MTEFEIDLLRLVASGKGRWGSILIGMRLPGRHLHQTSQVFKVLRHLASEGYVTHHVEPENPSDRWELTERGEDFLKSIPDEPDF